MQITLFKPYQPEESKAWT